MNDLKFALRQLLKNPGFTAVPVLTLALGIGANTAIFSVINGVLLKPLPYPNPQQLVTLWQRNPQRGIEQERVSGPNYLEWRAQNSVFSEMSVCPGWEGSEAFNLVLRDKKVKARATYASSSLFATLGVTPILGRTLLPEEDQQNGGLGVVLSYGLWQRVFAGQSNVLGQTLTVDTYGRRDYTIVGVMPSGFGLPSENELWLPYGWMGVPLDQWRGMNWYIVVARLKPGVTLARAQNEMNVIQSRIAKADPGAITCTEVSVVTLLNQALGRNLRVALWILWGVVVAVLLIACANVANLMLARAAARQKEIALRVAIGASRWRVMRQLLIESLLLATLGGALGVLLGWVGLQLFLAASPAKIPRLNELTLDITALMFTLSISFLTGVLFGLAPAWQFSRPNLNEALKEGGQTASSGATASRTRNFFIVTEVALSLVLLTGAGLMLQSFARMLHAERGFQPEHLVTAELDFSVSGFGGWTRPTTSRPQVPLHELIERLRTLPGVQAVGAGSLLLRRENRPPVETIAIFGRPAVKPEDQPRADFAGITPDWLRALGARVLRGRDFTEADTLEAPGVMLINETLARKYFPNEDPIGQHLKMGRNQPPLDATNRWGQSQWSTIVGIVSDVKSLHPQPEVTPQIYVPYWQWPMQNPTMLVRANGEAAALSAMIRSETAAVLPNLPPPIIRTMDDLLSETVAQPRLQSRLLALFASIALVLAVVGLYGVLAYLVAQRTREIGIRIALGAQRRDVLLLVIGQGMKLTLAGIFIGALSALALTQLMRSLLYGVTPNDPLTFVDASFVLFAAALFACWLPARRAANVHPIEALRYE
jgi:putative ABC transport system permease protein